MTIVPIDVWDVQTFDQELLNYLSRHTDLICRYLETDRRQFLEREKSQHRLVPPTNPYEGAHLALRESLMPIMAARTVRAWHYTRLRDEEVNVLERDGPSLSNLDGIRKRLENQVAANLITRETAERLWKGSSFHRQNGIRSGQFWMVSHPLELDDAGVTLLLSQWGGESIYFDQEDPEIIAILRRIGTPRVVEFQIQVADTRREFTAGDEVLSTFSKSIGCEPSRRGFSLCIYRPPGPESILKIHSEGDSSFEAMGRGYPERFAPRRTV